jgi:hypothetical protein
MKMITNQKIVYLEIEVPKSNYCWDGKTVCHYFDNTGGHGTCELKIGNIKSDSIGYLKPIECKNLRHKL